MSSAEQDPSDAETLLGPGERRSNAEAGARRAGGRSTGRRAAGGRSTGARREAGRLARRHPDIEIARLLVKLRLIEKGPAIECLKLQKRRAKAGKKRVPFLQLLVKREVLAPELLPQVQDEIRRHTYLCDVCDARAVILAGSQTRGGACPRCGAAITVDPPTSARGAVPVREFTRAPSGSSVASAEAGSGTLTWRPLGSKAMRGLPQGEVAFGKYLIREELGRGAMGVVYRATHVELAKDVALKVLVPSEEGGEHQVARFRREAAAVQKLHHEGIVAVHDFGTDGESYYLTMELIPGGGSLHRRLKDTAAPPSLRERVGVMLEVARAVQHAHEQGVIHRDLKPANVLLTPEGRAKVADFGLAKDEDAETGELTRTQDRLGTPLFMAPEQIRRGAASVDARADVWALGVMLFACVTGRYPFRSRTVMDLYLRIMREPPDWTGDRYSAPDRQGVAPLPPARGEPPSTHSADSHEATEVGPRDSAGELPQVLAERPPGAPSPPPFTRPPDLEGQPLPPALKAVIEGALAKDPVDRYPSAAAFAEDLVRFLEGEKVRGGGPKLLKRVRQGLWRRRVLRPLLATLALLSALSLVSVVVLVQRGRARAERLERDRRVDAAWAKAALQNDEAGYRETVAACDRELAVAADHVRALLRRAQARARLLEAPAARLDLEQAERVLAAAPAADSALWAAVAGLRARLELMAGEHAAAARSAARALEQAVASAEAPAEAALVTPAELACLLALAACGQGDAAALRTASERVGEVAARLGEGAPSQLLALLGRLALAQGELEQARAHLAAARRAGGDAPHLEVPLLEAALLLEAGQPPAAALEAAGRAFPERTDPEVSWLVRRGRDLYGEQRWEAVLRVNLETARLLPWCHKLHYYRGNLLLNRLARGAEALAAFREAAARDPYDRPSRDPYLATLLARPPGAPGAAAALDEAAAFLRREAQLLRPRAAEPLLVLGATLARKGELAAAWEALAAAAEREPGRAPLYAAAIARLGAERQGPWRARPPAALEREYGPARPLLELQDRVEVARVYLEAGALDHAAAQLEAALALPEPRRSDRAEQLPRSEALALAARLLAARGDVPQALLLLAEGAQRYTLSPQLTPDVLADLPELVAVRQDPRYAGLLASLEARGR